jgi:hypothetical protein
LVKDLFISNLNIREEGYYVENKIYKAIYASDFHGVPADV